MQKANKPWSKQAMEPLRNNWVTLASMIFLPNGGRATQSVNNNLHLRRYLNIVARQQQDNKSNQLDAGLSRATGQQDKGTTGQLNNWTTRHNAADGGGVGVTTCLFTRQHAAATPSDQDNQPRSHLSPPVSATSFYSQLSCSRKASKSR